MDLNFRVDSLERLKSKCGGLEEELRDPVQLKDFYQFAFNYAKNPNHKCLGRGGGGNGWLCVERVGIGVGWKGFGVGGWVSLCGVG